MRTIKILVLLLMLLYAAICPAQISTMGFNFNTATPKTPQEGFAKYFTGGYLTSGSYYQYLNPGKAISGTQAVSITALHYSWHQFDKQKKPAPLPVITAGLLDNVSMVQGAVNGNTKASYLVDIASVGGAFVLPVMNYNAYLQVGSRVAATYNAPFGDSLHALNTSFEYVTEFQEAGGVRTAQHNKPYLGVNADLSASAGIKVYNNWFVSLALGMRISPERNGKWYRQYDVDKWLTDPNELFSPEENYAWWTDDTLPDNNYFIHGSSYYVHLGISPFF